MKVFGSKMRKKSQFVCTAIGLPIIVFDFNQWLGYGMGKLQLMAFPVRHLAFGLPQGADKRRMHYNKIDNIYIGMLIIFEIVGKRI